MSVDLGTRNILDLLQFLNKTSGGFTYISGLHNDTSAIYLEGKCLWLFLLHLGKFNNTQLHYRGYNPFSNKIMNETENAVDESQKLSKRRNQTENPTPKTEIWKTKLTVFI